MADRSGKGRLKAWQGLGRGQGPRSREGSGSDFGHFGPQGSKFEGPRSKFEGRGRILVNFGRFGTFLGPCPESKNLIRAQGPLKKMALCRGILVRIWMGRQFWGQKFD